MQHRPLGTSGISIAPLMFGGNVFGWTADLRTSHLLLDQFTAGGFNAIDTADVYSAWVPNNTGGDSEKVIGAWLSARGRRDDVVIATKVGMWPKQPGLSKANIIAACEGSLQRLRTDYIDLYQSHQDDAATPQDETMEAFASLVKAGKVRAIGASNFTVDRLASAQKIAADAGLPRYDTLQPEYNLVARVDFESGPQAWCMAHDVAVIPYFGLASGFLTGKYRTEADLKKSARGPRVQKHLNPRGLAALDALDTAAKRHGATMGQVALAWLMTRPALAAPIASATSEAQLKELMGAVNVRLSNEDIWDLDRASATDGEG
ncbi:MAG: aldo/keto reductase [Alphaproteobacteria bacterium]|nr:MAG: aldo/keto reductase [Caulobacteraceae bacterium]TPW04010.1 MAG: aldo/keto reductase [Alphaproteobacteria bacterium]